MHWRERQGSVRSWAFDWGARHWFFIQALADATAWAVALTFATVVRWNFAVRQIDYQGLAAMIPLAGLAQTVSGLASGLYTGRWRFGSFEEVAALLRAAAVTTVLVFVLDQW